MEVVLSEGIGDDRVGVGVGGIAYVEPLAREGGDVQKDDEIFQPRPKGGRGRGVLVVLGLEKARR